MKEFNNLEEMEKYLNEETNTYEFIEDGKRLNIQINFNLDINAYGINARDINAWDINAGSINARDINAWDINAGNINAGDINAWDINAGSINARDISFYAVCTSYNSIYCTKCEGRRKNSIINTLDGDIYYKEE